MSEQWIPVLSTGFGVVLGFLGSLFSDAFRYRRQRQNGLLDERIATLAEFLSAHARYLECRKGSLVVMASYGPKPLDQTRPLSILNPDREAADRYIEVSLREHDALAAVRAAAVKISILWPELRELAMSLVRACTDQGSETQEHEQIVSHLLRLSSTSRKGL